MQLHTLLQQYGLTGTQSAIFVFLYQYGSKPASTIAKHIGGERTNVYKTIQTMVRQGFVAEVTQRGVKHFYIANKDILRQKILQEQEELEQKEKILSPIEAELLTLEEDRVSSLPKMRFFEGKSGVAALFEDMYQATQDNQYKLIKMFASNTLESQSSSAHQLKDYAKDFLKKIEADGVHIQAFLGNGILLLEQIFSTYDTQEIASLPAGHAAVQVFVVGKIVYVLIFKHMPIGIKLESEEFADVMHFLLKKACG